MPWQLTMKSFLDVRSTQDLRDFYSDKSSIGKINCFVSSKILYYKQDVIVGYRIRTDLRSKIGIGSRLSNQFYKVYL